MAGFDFPMTETADIHNTQSPKLKVPMLSSSQLLSLDISATFKMQGWTMRKRDMYTLLRKYYTYFTLNKKTLNYWLRAGGTVASLELLPHCYRALTYRTRRNTQQLPFQMSHSVVVSGKTLTFPGSTWERW